MSGSSTSDGRVATGVEEAPARGQIRLIAAIAVTVVALDAISKAAATHFLAGRGTVDVLGGAFHLELYRNFAGPGNSFQHHTVAISLFALAAVVAMIAIATRVTTRTSAIALGLVLGGGIGNLLDRLLRAPGPFRGGVVDWLKPTLSSGSMNLADLALNAAFVVLVAGTVLTWWRRRPRSGEALGA
jgi:signal peptidase II